MAELATKTCTPCQGGTPPMSEEDARRHVQETPGWDLLAQGTRIERRFTFKNFKQALDFVNEVGALAEEEQHHPDISFGWGYAAISLFTHKIKGLHENDFIMAAKINRIAAS